MTPASAFAQCTPLYCTTIGSFEAPGVATILSLLGVMIPYDGFVVGLNYTSNNGAEW